MAKMIGGKCLLDAINRKSEIVELRPGIVDQDIEVVVALPDAAGQSAHLVERTEISRNKLDLRIGTGDGRRDSVSSGGISTDQDKCRATPAKLSGRGSPQARG